MINWTTLEELSQHLKLSKPSLYKMAQEKRIPAAKLGRSWRFDRAKIDEWLTQKSTQTKNEDNFPWWDCLTFFLSNLQKKFGNRFASLWIYGSWIRGEAHPGSDIDLLVVLDKIDNFKKDFADITSLAYEATFGRNCSFVFSISLIDQKTFLTSSEPLMLTVRKEGKQIEWRAKLITS